MNKFTKLIEQFFFGLTRLLAVLGVIGGIALSVFLAMQVSKPQELPTVKLSDLTLQTASSNEETATNKPTDFPDEDGYKVPKLYKDFLFSNELTEDQRVENATNVNEWMKTIPRQYRQKAFDNLDDLLDKNAQVLVDKYKTADAVANAESAMAEADSRLIDQYQRYETDQIAKYDEDRYLRMGEKVATYMAIGLIVVFIVLLVLMLVLLSIERNTRQQNNA